MTFKGKIIKNKSYDPYFEVAFTYIEPTKLKVNEWLDVWLKEYMKPSL